MVGQKDRELPIRQECKEHRYQSSVAWDATVNVV